MRRITMVAMAAAAFIVAAASASAQVMRLPMGVWRGWLECPGGEIAFGMEFYESGDGRAVVIHNGAERIVVPDVAFDHGAVVISFPHYDSAIRADLLGGGTRLEGTWTKASREGKTIEMVFHAVQGEVHRYTPKNPPAEGVGLAGRWRAEFDESGSAVGEFQAGAEPGTVVGTFLTPTGDYRYLDGVIDGRTFTLSTFDGSHAFLCTGRVEDDGVLVGQFYSGPTFHEIWVAERENDATIPDGFSDVSWDPGVDPWTLRFTTADGSSKTLEEILGDRYGVVLEVMGTWCPNCTDAGRMIEDIRETMTDSLMLRVVSVAFEYTDDTERSLRQIEAYKERFGITTEVVLGGKATKDAVKRVLPGLSSFASYPTTIFITREGRVVAVHSGFAGPATGAEHERLRKRYVELMVEIATGH